jgi:hypothetical protein
MANYFLGCTRARHPALAYVLLLLEHRCRQVPTHPSDYDVLFLTGPDVVTEALSYVPSEARCVLLPQGAEVRHRRAGSWRSSNLR